LRITTQLVNAADGFHLWSESYDRNLTDVFAVQDEIAHSVVSALKVQLLPGLSARPATNPDAYAQFLLGRHLVKRGSPEGYRLGEIAFRKAVEMDPGYAPAWAMLARAIFYSADSVGWHAAGRQEDLARALEAADKAVQLAPDLPDGYVARGFLRSVKVGDWPGARSDLARALELSPGNAEALDTQGDLFATLGRLPEAIANLRKAAELDPLSPQALWRLAYYHLAAGHQEEARKVAIRSAELFPEHGHIARTLGFVLLLSGRVDEAEAAFRRSSIPAFMEMGTALVEHARGHDGQSRQALDHILAAWPKDMTYQIAEIHAFRGDKERAFEWLERGLALQDAGMRYIKGDPFLAPLRGDRRYTALLTKMKLPLD
jgi:tetratricopeptide (TPR) repeat protein